MTISAKVVSIQPRHLKLKQAVLYSGIGEKRLKAMARDPSCTVQGSPDPGSNRRDWVFDRESIDDYWAQVHAASMGDAQDVRQRLGIG